MAAANERESAVLELMRRRFDHVSAERCLSGPGLVNLYNSLAALDSVPAAPYTAAQITDPDTSARDPLCREATAMFCAMLGTVAGDLALTLGAQGGVYLAGGIVPRLGARFSTAGSASGLRPRADEGPSRGDPELCRDPPAAGVYGLRRRACRGIARRRERRDNGAMDVGDWLRNLDLGQYAAAFRDNEIDASVLPV